MHLIFFFLPQSEGRDHTSSPFLPEGAVCTNLLFHFGPKILSGLEAPSTLTDRPAATTLGPLGSAAMVNNECMFLLHITRLVMMSILCQLHLFFSSCVNKSGRYGRCVGV